jgi:hypothetical protein
MVKINFLTIFSLASKTIRKKNKEEKEGNLTKSQKMELFHALILCLNFIVCVFPSLLIFTVYCQ